MARAARTAAAHSKLLSEEISLPPQRDLQVRWKDTSLPPMEEISLPPWQKSASAPQLPTSTSATARAARTTTAHLPPTLENQPSTTARYTSTSSTAPNVNIGNGKSSKDSSSILANPVGRNQPSATAIPTSISSRHAESMAPNVNFGNDKSSKDSSNSSKGKGRA